MIDGARNSQSDHLSSYDRLRTIDTGPAAELEALARAAALVCETPISLISVFNENTQWFKANFGLEGVTEGERKVSFCSYVLDSQQMMEIQDASKDERFADNPMVTGAQHVRFYAGFPLQLSDGEQVGTLCVVGRERKTLTPAQIEILGHIATAAEQALEARLIALREHELLVVEAEARSILQNSPDAIVTMDNDGTIQHWNNAAEQLFGYSAEQATGQNIAMIIPPELSEAQSNLASRLRENRSDRSNDTQRLHRNGSRIPVSVSIGPLISSSGDITGATEIIRDISAIVKTNRDLAAAENRIDKLYRSTPAMLHSTDQDGRLLSVSDRWLEVMKYNRDEVIGRDFGDFLTPEFADFSHKEFLPALLFEGQCENMRFQMVNRAGQMLNVLLSATLERDNQGNPLRIISTIEDVTQRRKAENALIEERRRLQQIIDSTRSGTWEWHAPTGELRLNHRWLRILGYQPEELEPTDTLTWRNRIHPDDLKDHDTRLAAHLNDETENYECEMRVCHKSGEWIWTSVNGRVLTWSETGKPEWMFGTLRDITSLKNEQEELRKSREFLERTGRIAGVGGWEVDLVNQKIFWSEETCRIHGVEFGYETDLEKAIAFYAPESRGIVEAAVEKAMSDGTPWDLELQLIRTDRQKIWVRAAGTAQFDSENKPIRLIGAFQDISEQVDQRLELEQLNERMAAATENGRIGVWDANLLTGYTHYSDIWCDLIGYTPEEVGDAGDEWLKFLHPDDIERAQNADVAHIRGENTHFEEEFRMRHKDGRWIWILDRGRVVARAEDGTPLRMIGTHTDITARKNAEQERALMSERIAIATDSGGIGIWELEVNQKVTHWDKWMYRLYGLDPKNNQEDINEVWQRSVHEEDRERIGKAVYNTIETGGHLDEEYRIINADGSTRHLRIAANLVYDQAGLPQRVIGAAWDVSARRQLTLDLAEQHELMRVTLDSIGDAVITTDANGNIRWLNPVAEHMTGWSVENAKGMPSEKVFCILNEDTRETAPNPIAACLEAKKIVGLAENTMLFGRHGFEYSIEDSVAPIRSSEGEILGAVLVFHDVSEQRRLSREMTYRASHDPLTGLINRSEFDRRLKRTFETAQQNNTDNVLLYIDLDQFKIVNDTCGHAVGDTLLKKVSELMQGCLRTRDTLARLGGDEFAVLLEYCKSKDGLRVAQKICDRMSKFRFVHEDKHFRVGTSIGLVPINSNSASVSSLLQAADTSCYVAKESGRNRVHVWEETDESLMQRSGETRWVSRIEQALEQGSFELYAQSIVPISDHQKDGHTEILLRMIGDNGEVIPPGTFMPAAERFNLMPHIDRWVLGEALRQISATDLGDVTQRICINLSGQSFGDRAFHTDALKMLDEAGGNICRKVCIEITETAIITKLEEASTFIKELRFRGIAVALDDFGAGSSSFRYLKSFSLDYLKIDGQFVSQLLSDPLNEATIRCFVEVAQILGLETIAEFVGDEKTRMKLKALGVDYAQGFFVHKPEPLRNVLGSLVSTH